ncbi:MAG: type II secretion system protein PulP [Desulfuromonadaceae bacterium]|nr:type II secretion system protein PulP [Desulfuromonadaceae bacterium]
MNRQRLILFILVIVLGITIIWSYNAIPRPKTISSVATTSNKPGKQGRQPKTAEAAVDKPIHSADDGTKLKVSLLDSEPPHFKGYRRNIFKPVFVDEMKILRQKAMAIKPPPPPPPKPVPPPVMPVVIQPEAAPLARFKFLGFLKKGSVRTVFLAKDKDIILVKKGDKVAGRYEATEISDQALTLTVSDSGDEIVIPLVENRPLVPVR